MFYWVWKSEILVLESNKFKKSLIMWNLKMRIFRTDCVKLLYKISVLSKCVYSFYVVIISLHRSSHPEVFCKKCFLRKCAKFTRKHLCQNFIKKEALAQVFSCEFCKTSKNTFLQNTSGRLPLNDFVCWKLCNSSTWKIY